MDVLDELVSMNVEETSTVKAPKPKETSHSVHSMHTTPPPTKEASVLDQMLEAFAGTFKDGRREG